MNRLLLGIAILGGVLFAARVHQPDLPERSESVTVALATVPDPTTTTGAPEPTQAPIVAFPTLVGPDTPCQEWVPTALEAGWPADRQILETLMSVLYRESRCQPLAWNGHDAGLAQINQIHAAWIAELGLGQHPDAMFDPLLNLTFAWRLYSSREANGQCGWTPWSLRCS